MKNNYKNIIDVFESTDLDYSRVSREELDLSNGRNTNIFAYKGQFSPDLIKSLLKVYGRKGGVVLDPFVGCGTTLYEAAKCGMSGFGVEINPAAIEMARTVKYINIPLNKRKSYSEQVLKIVEKNIPFKDTNDTFFDGVTDRKLHDCIEDLLLTYKQEFFLYNILVNAYIKLLSSKDPSSSTEYIKQVKEHIKLIQSLPESKLHYDVFHCDARKIPLNDKSVDLVVTSPPYVNVFNYHQHNRKFIDRVYGNALHVAKSEFGANRKHRQNRFLTVVQYLLDMSQTFLEIKRLLKKDGRIIVIVGKSTKVRGINFRNDYIITGVGMLTGYKLISRQERMFKNQFGQDIYEGLLHFSPTSQGLGDKMERWYGLGKEILENASSQTVKEDVKNDLVDAIDKCNIIKPSPIFV